MTSTTELYYVRNKHSGYLGNAPVWWGKNGRGYTAYILGAERFTKEDAQALVTGDPEKNEMHPCDEIDKRLHLVFDCQDFKNLGTNNACGWDSGYAPCPHHQAYIVDDTLILSEGDATRDQIKALKTLGILKLRYQSKIKESPGANEIVEEWFSAISATLRDPWQLIEKAPKDGTPIFVWTGNAEFPSRHEASWRIPTDSEYWVSGSDEPSTEEETFGPEAGWFDESGYYTRKLQGDNFPTHFMLIPDGPQAQKGGA